MKLTSKNASWKRWLLNHWRSSVSLTNPFNTSFALGQIAWIWLLLTVDVQFSLTKKRWSFNVLKSDQFKVFFFLFVFQDITDVISTLKVIGWLWLLRIRVSSCKGVRCIASHADLVMDDIYCLRLQEHWEIFFDILVDRNSYSSFLCGWEFL